MAGSSEPRKDKHIPAAHADISAKSNAGTGTASAKHPFSDGTHPVVSQDEFLNLELSLWECQLLLISNALVVRLSAIAHTTLPGNFVHAWLGRREACGLVSEAEELVEHFDLCNAPNKVTLQSQ